MDAISIGDRSSAGSGPDRSWLMEESLALMTPSLHRWSPDLAIEKHLLDRAGDAVLVWLIELDRDEPELGEVPLETWFGETLSPEEMLRAKRLIRPRDRLRFARCRSAVRSILGQLQGVKPSDVRFGAGAYGKPFLDRLITGDANRPIEFNVSHSGSLGLIAVSHGRPVGIDLEQIRSIREAERIAASFFTEEEQAQFAGIGDAERDAAFMRGWTRKEAVLKGVGKGLVGKASQYRTMFGTSRLTDFFQPATPCPIVDGWSLWEAEIAAGYVATLAIDEGTDR